MMINEDTILEYVQLAIRGDSKAFEKLISHYDRLIISLICRINRGHVSPDLMLSLKNRCYFQIYGSLKGFKGNSKFSTYVYTVVQRLLWALKDQDKHYYRVNNELFEELPSTTSFSQEIVDKDYVKTILGKLSCKMRICMDLRYLQNYSLRDVAHVLGETKPVIKNRIYRAKEKLKQKKIVFII